MKNYGFIFKPSEEGEPKRGGWKLSEETKAKMRGRTPWNKGKTFPHLTGAGSPSWKGGLPNCGECGKQLSYRKGKLCVRCNLRINPTTRIDGRTKNPAYHAFLQRKRTYKKRGAGGSHTMKQWEDLKKFYNYMCLCCKQQEPFVKLTEDHVIPISAGGNNDISNIQPLCGSCNSRKHAKTVDYRLEKLFV